MAADINTQLQNISTDVTAIGNLVNRLTTIFSAGGVQNPDIAVLKSELQSDYNTKFAGVLHLGGTSETISVIKYVSAYFNFTGDFAAVHTSTYDTTTATTGSHSFTPIRLNLQDGKAASLVYTHTASSSSSVFTMSVRNNKLSSNNDAEARLILRYDSDFRGVEFFGYAHTQHLYPAADNVWTLGSGTLRYKTLYSNTGTINTSDKNYKVDIDYIPEAVLRAWGKVNFKQFKFIDAVEEKGAAARVHVGFIANELVDSVAVAFSSEGLDPTRYGLFCYDSWEDEYSSTLVLETPEVYEDVSVVDAMGVTRTERKLVKAAVYRDERKLIKKAGGKYSLRYEECLALECAYQRWQLQLIKSKLGL